MKKLILLCLSLFVAGFVSAQESGKIQYELTLNIHATLKPDQLQFKDLIPETSTVRSVLFFNGGNAKIMLLPENTESEEGGVKMKIQMDNSIKFIETASQSIFKLDESGSQKKLIVTKFDENGEKQSTSKIGTKTKTIAGYTCKEVKVKSDDGPITLWVTDKLPFKGGIIGMYSPYGAILGMESKKMSILATSIQFEPVDPGTVKIPEGVPIEESNGKLSL